MVCEYKPHKEDPNPNRTRITISGNQICYPGNVDTPTASLKLVKLLINSVLSRRGAKFAIFDIENFYLNTPLERYAYVRIKLTNIPEEFIADYNLHQFAKDGWVYFEIRKGVYGLPQAGNSANDLLTKRLNAKGYYQTDTTPGLWRHKWRPIISSLIVDNFGIEYVGKHHARHLQTVLRKHYTITEDWTGLKYAGIDLAWDYFKRTCRLSLDGYIKTLIIKYGHTAPDKPQLSPHKHIPFSTAPRSSTRHPQTPAPL